jgi:hypothetical protein
LLFTENLLFTWEIISYLGHNYLQELLDIMHKSGADFTLTFCALGEDAILKSQRASISAI